MCRDSLQDEERGSPRQVQPWHLHTLKSFRILWGRTPVMATPVDGDPAADSWPWVQGPGPQTSHGAGAGAGWGEAHMAVMVSLWKVTKAMPRGFSFTFSFSRL